MSITFDDPATIIEPKDFKRDRWGRPHIMQPDGKRIAYTRCSSAAKTIEDTYNLERWDNRNIAFGMSYDASLVARVLAIGGDPASWNKDEKDAVNDIVEAARSVAKAHKAADIGTAVHRLTHRIDRGEDVHGGPYQADLDAYRAAMTAAGLTCHPEWIECRMVNDELRMAGTADRIVKVVERHRIADVKTGASIDFGGLGWTAQGAAYAGGLLYDTELEERLSTPDIDQQIGYIIHLPAGQGRCAIYEMDLVAGLAAAKLANEIRATRKASKTWITPLQIAPGAVPPSPVEQAASEDLPPSGAAGNAAADATGSGEIQSSRRRQLLDRFEALDPVDKKRFKAKHVPNGDFDTIEKLLDEISRRHEPPDPPPTTTPSPGEGDSLREAEVDVLERRFNELSEEAKAWTGALVAQGNKGHSWRIKRAPTVRRFELYRGVLTLAEYFGDAETESFAYRDDIIRAIVHAVTGIAFFDIEPGHLLGSLDAEYAAKFAEVAVDLTKDRYQLLWGDDGTLRLVAVA